MLTEFSSLTDLRKGGKMSKWFLACAKRTAKIFDPVKAVLSMKLLSPGCTLVTLRSETKWYISTPDPHTRKPRRYSCWWFVHDSMFSAFIVASPLPNDLILDQWFIGEYLWYRINQSVTILPRWIGAMQAVTALSWQIVKGYSLVILKGYSTWTFYS